MNKFRITIYGKKETLDLCQFAIEIDNARLVASFLADVYFRGESPLISIWKI